MHVPPWSKLTIGIFTLFWPSGKSRHFKIVVKPFSTSRLSQGFTLGWSAMCSPHYPEDTIVTSQLVILYKDSPGISGNHIATYRPPPIKRTEVNFIDESVDSRQWQCHWEVFKHLQRFPHWTEYMRTPARKRMFCPADKALIARYKASETLSQNDKNKIKPIKQEKHIHKNKAKQNNVCFLHCCSNSDPGWTLWVSILAVIFSRF